MKNPVMWLAAVFVFALAMSGLQARPSQGRVAQDAASHDAICAPESPCALRLARIDGPRGKRTRTNSAASKQQQKKSTALERVPYTEQDREAAIVPGLPGV